MDALVDAAHAVALGGAAVSGALTIDDILRVKREAERHAVRPDSYGNLHWHPQRGWIAPPLVIYTPTGENGRRR